MLHFEMARSPQLIHKKTRGVKCRIIFESECMRIRLQYLLESQWIFICEILLKLQQQDTYFGQRTPYSLTT